MRRDIDPKLPNLKGYLTQRVQKRVPNNHDVWGYGCVAAPAWLTLMGYALTQWTTWYWAIILTAVMGLPLLALVIGMIIKMRGATASEEVKRNRQVRDALKPWIESANQGQLRSRVDPTAGRILESCAMHHERIMKVVESPFFKSDTLPSHYAALRDQAHRAADDAMLEAVLSCNAYLGKGQGKREIRWNEVVSELIAGDFDEAIAGIKGEPSRREFNVEPNEIEPGLLPAYQTALQLKRLAHEMEHEAQRRASEIVKGEGAAQTGLNVALAELKAIRQAEAELDAEVRRQRLGQ